MHCEWIPVADGLPAHWTRIPGLFSHHQWPLSASPSQVDTAAFPDGRATAALVKVLTRRNAQATEHAKRPPRGRVFIMSTSRKSVALSAPNLTGPGSRCHQFHQRRTVGHRRFDPPPSNLNGPSTSARSTPGQPRPLPRRNSPVQHPARPLCSSSVRALYVFSVCHGGRS